MPHQKPTMKPSKIELSSIHPPGIKQQVDYAALQSIETSNDDNFPHDPQKLIAEAAVIGFFDPDYQASSSARNPIRTSRGEFVYRDVFAFIERLRAVASTQGTERMRVVLPSCLRNSARTWYDDELDDYMRDLLSSDCSDLETWYGALSARFKASGTRLAQSSVVVPLEQGDGRGRKGKKLEHWGMRSGEVVDEWQMRIGRERG